MEGETIKKKYHTILDMLLLISWEVWEIPFETIFHLQSGANSARLLFTIIGRRQSTITHVTGVSATGKVYPGRVTRKHPFGEGRQRLENV